MQLETAEEKELWKQVYTAYVAGRAGNVVKDNACHIADQAVHDFRKRTYEQVDTGI